MTDAQDRQVGARLGRSAGRFVRAARKATGDARPGAQQAARQALDRAQPAAQQAAQYARTHEGELRQAGAIGARLVVSRIAPPALRPVIAALATSTAATPTRRHEDTGSDATGTGQAPRESGPAADR